MAISGVRATPFRTNDDVEEAIKRGLNSEYGPASCPTWSAEAGCIL